MHIRARPILPKDVRKCVEIVAAHQVLGPRYAETLKDLPEAMLSLMGRDAFTAVVFEEANGTSVRNLGAAVATFVTQDFLREVKTPPFFWATPELLRRMKRGESPVLSDKQVREANSTGGLRLHVWHTGVSLEDNNRAEVQSALVGEFVRQYRGYRIMELIQQAESLENFRGMRMAGGMRVSPKDGHYEDYWEIGPVDVIKGPQLVGLTAEMAHHMKASWISTLFNYEPPRFVFTRGEQRLLTCALDGGTDEEISNQLGISLSAVKKTWRKVYQRVESNGTAFVPTNAKRAEREGRRGKEKKNHLLAYLREHPEELRPFSSRMLKRLDGSQSSEIRKLP
jgi:DNA-binding CsgD family transcriptional regulator